MNADGRKSLSRVRLKEHAWLAAAYALSLLSFCSFYASSLYLRKRQDQFGRGVPQGSVLADAGVPLYVVALVAAIAACISGRKAILAEGGGALLRAASFAVLAISILELAGWLLLIS